MKPTRTLRRIGCPSAFLLFLVIYLAFPADAATRRKVIEQGLVAALTDSGEIYLEAVPLRGEGLWAFSRRLTGGTAPVRDRAITLTDGRAVSRLLRDQRYRVPYGYLLDDYKVRVLRSLFPDDIARYDGWLHTPPRGGGGETLWNVGLWFTGRGDSFKEIRQANRLAENSVDPGVSVLIPKELLLPPLKILLPSQPPQPPPAAAPVAPPARPSTETPYGLEYESDDTGTYAVYRLKPGEALYSSVVVRFTGRIHADDVNALAVDIATLNRIPDVTDIPVGRRIRIPSDVLLPEFLPPSDPRHLEWEQNRTASAQVSNTVRSSRLEGITVILDSGHGGQDPGATNSGVREALYVYDIMVRVKNLLEARTAARVEATVRDGPSFRIHDGDILPVSTGHQVLTHPPYAITDSTVGTHLRWYLANSLHSAAVRKSQDDGKTVFVSIHADSLHPSLRGAMVYIPAVSLTKGAYGKTGSVYTGRSEVKDRPRVDFSWQERVRSEGLSRQLAEQLMSSFRRHGLAIHPEQEIRDRIIRCRRCRPFVPAVIRRNAVPAKVLLEVCNLNNVEDRKLLKTRNFRHQVAQAVVEGILAYYGQSTAQSRTAAGRP